MSTIILRNVSFAYSAPAHDVFEKLDLTIDGGWRAGLVGRNGRGKTTLLKLIAREIAPQAGEVVHAFATRYFPFRPADPTRSTAEVVKNAIAPFSAWEAQMATLLEHGGKVALAEYAELIAKYEGLGGYSIDARVVAAMSRLGLSEAIANRPFVSLSPGEQTKALIASLFVTSGTFALIDEPTNHLDLEGRERLADFLAAQTGFLMVSHDRAFLDRCIDHVVALRRDGVTIVHASYTVWRELEQQRLAFETRHNETLKREIRALEEAAHARREGAHARERDKAPHTDKGYIGRRAAKQMKRAVAMERRIERRVEQRRTLLRSVDKHRRLRVDATAQRRRRLLVANDFTVARAGRVLFEPVDFVVSSGDRLAILGTNGCGKSSLLAALLGEPFGMPFGEPFDRRGVVTPAKGLRVTGARQNPQWVSGRVRDRLAADRLDPQRFFDVMGSSGVRGELLEKPLETLSAGEQKKLELARTLIVPADLLVWDEPLNAIDVESREQIEDLLAAADVTLIFVEHDRRFIENVATQSIRLVPFGG